MDRARPLLLALLVVSVSVIAVPIAAALPHGPTGTTPFQLADSFGPEPVSEPDLNLSARLELPSDAATGDGAGTVGLDAGALLTADGDGAEAAYRRALLDARLERADSGAERRNTLRNTRDEYRAVFLDIRQREAIAGQGLAEGSQSPDDVLDELALIHLRAGQYEPMVEHLERRASEEPDVSLSNDVRHLETELETMRGPIRTMLARGMTGDGTVEPVYVAGAQEGLILAHIDDDQFVRETVRLDNRNPGGEIQLTGLTAAINRTETLYPQTFTDRGSLSFVEASDYTYQASSSYDGGSIDIYLDRSTANVYKEHQRLTVTQLETREAVNRTADDLHLVVDRTYGGGPALIRVTQPASDTPVDGAVSVDGTAVGTTGSDGELWIVAPRGGMNVTVTDGPSEVSGSVRFGATDGEDSSA